MTSSEEKKDPDPNRKQVDDPSKKKRRVIVVTGKSTASKPSTGQSSTAQQRQVSVPTTTTTQPDTVAAPTPSPAAGEHMQWLNKISAQLKEPSLAQQWFPHREWLKYTVKENFTHFTAFDFDTDHQYIWRFSSLPSAEMVSIVSDTALATIIHLIGEHSGGNKKDDPRVRTSSFCRNIGALIGVAASSGGDKKVLNIVNRTPYLCRIDLTTLPNKGVSAVPALSRAISLFETEYVLVPTPGKTHFLANTGANVTGTAGCLDAVVFRNPFFGCIDAGGDFAGCVINANLTIGGRYELPVDTPAAFNKAGLELPPVTPEVLGGVADLDEGDIVRILCYAVAVSEVATELYADVIKDKDPTTVGKIAGKVAEYASAVEKRYRHLLSTVY